MVRRLMLALIAPALLLGCSSTRTVRVAVPPRVDLGAYQTIGLVGFHSNKGDDLAGLSTQKFLQAMQSAQPGTRVLELGTEAQVLASVNQKSWTPAAFRAVKELTGVDAVFVGSLSVEKAKPDISISSFLKQMNVRADVNSSLAAKLLETDKGATVWSDSADLTANIANASVNNRGGGFLDVTDPEKIYGKMIDDLVFQVSDDFRTHYVTRRVPKEQIETASSRD